MTNRLRGETPMPVASRPQYKVQPYLVYGTREIARMQAELGARPVDPFAPSIAIVEDVGPVMEEVSDPKNPGTKIEREKLGEDGLPVYIRKRVLLDHAQRQRRWLQHVTARFQDPDDEAVAICVRIGLDRWAKAAGVEVTTELVDEFREELGRVGMHMLHSLAVQHAVFLSGVAPEEGDDTKAPSGAASSTSNT